MKFIKLYGSYLRVFLKSQMEYKVSFFSGMFANFYCYLITYLSFWVLVQSFATIAGWTFSEMTVLYGLDLLSYALAGTLYWNSVLHMEQTITQGQLDRYLLRPVGILKQLVCQYFGYTFLGQIAVTILFLATAFARLAPQMSPWVILYFFLAVIGGILIQSGAMILCGSISFWTLRSSPLAGMFYYDFRQFTRYPLSIYPRYLQFLLTFIFPWAIINYYPSLIVLGKTTTILEVALGLSTPLVGAGFFALSVFVFYRGLRRYNSAGN